MAPLSGTELNAKLAEDAQVYTRKEFEERAALPVSFERTVKSKGRLVHAA